MISRQTSLSGNIIQFCRFLRTKGYLLGVEEELIALQGLRIINNFEQGEFRLLLRALLCKNKNELTEFEDLFDEFWKELNKAINSKEPIQKKPVSKPSNTGEPFKALHSWLHGNRNEEVEETASYSTGKSLSQKDFSLIPADELDELVRIIHSLSKNLAAHLSRRYKSSGRKGVPDLRRTLRKNMRYGAEFFSLAYKVPKQNRTKLVILCDVSKSMDLYSSFLLQFMYAFQQVYARIESFAFSTSLQHITQLLKNNDFITAMKSISNQNTVWSGGTRIGESLDHFVHKFASSFLNKRTIVIILSDGWDTGEIVLLQKSMAHIHKHSRRVIWLNPLAGYQSFQPEVAGMKAALPYIDVLASIHNAESLRKLIKWL